MKRHWDWIAVAGLVLAVAVFLTSGIGSNRDEIGQVRSELSQSSDRILGVLSDIKANTAVARSELDRSQKDIDNLKFNLEMVKYGMYDLNHRIDEPLTAPIAESPTSATRP